MRALLFSIDVLPYRNRVQTSGGSLRSQQFVDRFEEAGFEVIKAVPSQSLLVKTQRHLLGEAGLRFFDVSTQAELVAETRPDVIVWAWPMIAQIPIKPLPEAISIVDLNGFQNIESAASSGAEQRDVTLVLLRRARHADIIVYGSSEQRAYWEGLFRLEFEADPLPTGFVLPYHDPARTTLPYADGPLDFFYVGSFLPWLSPFKALFTLADALEATPSRLRIFASTQPVSVGDTSRESLERLADHPNVVVDHPLPYEQLYRRIGFRGVGFDLLEESFERRFAYPIRTVSFLTHGIPLLYNDFSCLSEEVARSGAGWITSQNGAALRDCIGGILAEPHGQRAARSKAATELAERLFACPDQWKGLFERLRAPAAIGGVRAGRVGRARPPNVLVVSDDHLNILNLRCVAPLESLLRQDLIGGYAVVGKKGVRRSTIGLDRHAEINSVVVQRVPDIPSVTVADLTQGRFVYDIDDNLLAAPSYRPPFPLDFGWKVRSFLAEATTITLTTPFLARTLATMSGLDVAGRARIVPNPLLRRCRSIEERPVKRVLFASSDELPLLDSAQHVFSAIGAFCRRHGLEFCYVGSFPHNAVFREYLQGVRIRHLEPKGYDDYLDMIEGIDALAVVPLETRGDPATVDFIRAKSDIKAVEYLGMGRPAVFSDAAPYRYSDLPLVHLVPNDEECWTAALELALNQDRPSRSAASAVIEEKRWIGGRVSAQWLDPLLGTELRRPLPMHRVLDTIDSDLARLRFSAWPAESFDAMFYLEQNRDVQLGMEAGTIDTAYGHYLRHGRTEGRRASPCDTGRTLVDHIEEAKAIIVDIDADLNRTDHRISQFKRQFGVTP